MYKKEIWVDFSEDADCDYKELQKKAIEEKRQGIKNSFNVQLLKAIDREKANLKINPQHGTHIPRKYISKALAKRYATDRLWNTEKFKEFLVR